MKVEIHKSVMEVNNEIAAEVRRDLEARGIVAINVMASPGAGKTSFIELTHKHAPDIPIAVIEGDVATDIDTRRLRAQGIETHQVNTGGGCHLTARMVQDSLPKMKLDGVRLLFIENVGNLICPGAYDLGEAIRLVLPSVAEGSDKPRKYPGLFQKADVIVLNKIDLVEPIGFDIDYFTEGLRNVNADAPLFPISCKTESGLASWLAWLRGRVSPGVALA
jgi:hydrogenase nickel incorporation protein HypB